MTEDNAIRVLMLVLLASLLSGCAAYNSYLTQGVDGIAKLNDRALRDAEFVTCRGASKGSIDRRYGGIPELYTEWCKATNDNSIPPKKDSK